jgi:general stress protein 26
MHDIKRVAELLGGLGPAVLLSSDGVGMVHVGRARGRAGAGGPGTLWFLADAGRVAAWQAGGQPVSLTYHAPNSPYFVTLQGVAGAVADTASRAAAWDPRFAPWFPGGPADPRLALLEVAVTSAACVEWRRLAG